MRDNDDEDDWDEDDEDDGTVACPYCGASMYEEAGYCSSCERWISREDQPRAKLPAWAVIVILLLLACFVVGALRGF